MSKTLKYVLNFVGMAVLLAVLIIGNVACGLYSNIITQYLCGFGLDVDSEAAVAARSSGNALAAQVEEDGAVLLKNDGTLPLKNKRVNVFGFAGSDNGFIPQGTGSGTGSRNDYVTFLGGLKEAGFEYNEALAADYDALGWRRVDRDSFVFEASGDAEYKKYYGVVEADASFYNETRMSNARNYSDTAIVVLGRLLGEGNDYSKIQYIGNDENDTSRKLQSISVREEYMLQKVCENFDKVVVVLNTSNPMELGFIENEGIGAAIFMGLPGTRGSIGLANILSGKVNPSGHLTDTWAYDLSTAASYATSGREGVNTYPDVPVNGKTGDTSLNARINKYSDYLEDIYVGYKWYETADAEGFWNSAYAKNLWNIEDGYADVVQFPFGYGMSYTKFEWTVIDCNYANGAVLDKNGTIEIKLAVENVGDVAGKDVIQLYYSAPYKSGGIEKSAVNLGAFAKTALLEPGKVENITLELPVEDMKSYDCYDKNGNGFMGYELEGGEYVVSLRTDAHTLAVTGNADRKNSYTFRVPAEGYRYEIDSVSQNPVRNQFTNFTAASGASSTVNEPAVKKAHSIDGGDEPEKITYLTRKDFQGTFPETTPANRLAGQTLINDTLYVTFNPVNDPDDVAPAFNSKLTSWTVNDLLGIEYDDPMWNELVSQLSIETAAKLIVQGGFGTIEIKSIGKPATVDADGPCGFNNAVTGSGNLRAVCYPSSTIIGSTWDWYAAYQVGKAIGIEGNATGANGLYGPGANLHRSPMGGRNFEYYSEDARLSGIMCAYEVYGAKEQGLATYVKHIAVNDSESGRGAAYKWLTEQNLRENYLLPFELIVKVGKGNALMSSIDRVGSTRASASYAMLTAVLRDEWGFDGTVITDYYQNAKPTGGPSAENDVTHDVDECVRAGNSLLLWTDGDIRFFNDYTSATAQKAIFKSAKDILYTYADCKNFAEVSQGLEKGSMIGNSVSVFAWWKILLVAVDVIVAAGLAVWALWLIKPGIFKRKKNNSLSEE